MSELRIFANNRIFAEVELSPMRSQISVVSHNPKISSPKDRFDLFGSGDGIHLRGVMGPDSLHHSIASTIVSLR